MTPSSHRHQRPTTSTTSSSCTATSARVAPLAIEQEWGDLVVNYETASTVDPGDPESVQRVVETAVRTEESVTAVQQWVAANCDVDLGPVATVQPPPPTSSVAPSVPAEDDD